MLTQELRATNATLNRTLDTILLEPTLAVFRISYDVQFDGNVPSTLLEKFKPLVQEGFATPEAIQDFIDDKVTQLESIPGLMLVPNSFLADVKHLGYMAAFINHETIYDFGRSPYVKFQTGEVTADNLIFAEWDSHLIFDRKKELVPTARFFNYTSGRVHDGHYDLAKLVDILKKDSRIIPIDGRQVPDGVAPPELTIQDIPYYSAGEGRSTQVAFRYIPTNEDMSLLWTKMKSYGANHPANQFYRAVFDLDTLGLRKGGAAKLTKWIGP